MSIISESEMSERPTPETDAAWSCFKGYMEPLQDVKDLSRKLERERDEAREAFQISYKERVEMEFDRNEWRKCAKNFAAIIGAPDQSTWATDEEINSAWLFFSETKGGREMSRPTPETDAAEAKRRAEWLHKHKAHKDWIILSVSEIAVIRDELLILERERDEANEELHKQLVRYDQLFDEAEKNRIERDEAREEVEFLKKTPLRQRCQELERLSDHWCDMHTVAAKGRDEARELLESEKITRNHIIHRGIEMQKELAEAREQNAKLISIAERAIDDLRWFYENKADGVILELEQLKKETK